MTAVRFEDSERLAVGRRSVLFEVNYVPEDDGAGNRQYDVAPDGRFLMLREDPAQEVGGGLVEINIALNWFEELRERVPIP